MKNIRPRNTELIGLFIGLLFFFISSAVFILPFVLQLDMMEIGFGIIFVSFFFGIVSLVVILIYLYRVLTFESIVNGERRLAYWQFEAEVYVKEVNKKYEESRKENSVILVIMWIFFLVFTILFLCVGFFSGEGESMGWFAGTMCCIALVVSIFGFLMPVLYRFVSGKAIPEAYIAKNGIIYAGQLHTWNAPFAYLDHVQISPDNKHITFIIMYFTKLGWYKYQDYSVNIPIPKGKISEAENIVNALQKVE